jgi:hypothetical protein
LTKHEGKAYLTGVEMKKNTFTVQLSPALHGCRGIVAMWRSDRFAGVVEEIF